MSTCPGFDHLLILPHLRVQNANAVSSPLTHGFPSITAFLGLMWALERKTRAAGLDLAFNAVGVVCHDHQELVTDGGYVKTFRLNKPAVRTWAEASKLESGSLPSIVEEGRIHLKLSLIFAIDSERWTRDPEAQARDLASIANLLGGMRVAGGTLVPPAQPGRHRYQPYVVALSGTEEDQWLAFRKTRMRLLPGFTLVARDDLLETRLSELQADQPEASRLDAWLSLARINWRYKTPAADTEEARKEAWTHDRAGLGWIVPIPVGYGALGDVHPPGTVANARDPDIPFRFAESVYSVGEWISPHRLHAPEQMLWYADSHPDDGLYRCRNDYAPETEAAAPAYDFD